jgi:hypothetical protein
MASAMAEIALIEELIVVTAGFERRLAIPVASELK